MKNIFRNKIYLISKIFGIIIIIFFIILLTFSFIFDTKFLVLKPNISQSVSKYSKNLRHHFSLHLQNRSIAEPTLENFLILRSIVRNKALQVPQDLNFINELKYVEFNLIKHKVLIFYNKLNESELSNLKNKVEFFFYYDIVKNLKSGLSYQSCYKIERDRYQYARLCDNEVENLNKFLKEIKIVESEFYDKINFSKLTILYFEFFITKIYLFLILLLTTYISFFYCKKVDLK